MLQILIGSHILVATKDQGFDSLPWASKPYAVTAYGYNEFSAKIEGKEIYASEPLDWQPTTN